ncbi:MAG: hypothetical protein QOD63_3058, partial [Actinomycetota bacterium]|nr:hypothetical protein [Actinomycetota bacterium]
DTAPADVEAFSSGLAGLPAVIPSLRGYRFGPDAGLGLSANGDFAVVADFDDDEGYRAYASHPAHQDVIVRLLRPILGSRLSVQFRWDEARGAAEPTAGSR